MGDEIHRHPVFHLEFLSVGGKDEDGERKQARPRPQFFLSTISGGQSVEFGGGDFPPENRLDETLQVSLAVT
jgi:hypothetical protein